MFSIGPDLSSTYFGLQDEVNALAQTSAIAPFIQTANALATWKTSDVGPLSEKNLLKNNTVYLDDEGNITDLSSTSYIPRATETDPNIVYINDSNGHLYRGGIDLEATGSGNVIAPLSQTTTAIPTWGAANTLTNSSVLLDNSANITGIGTLKLLNKTAITDNNTLWINALDGQLYRGVNNIEADAGNVTTNIPIGTANNGYVIVSSGSTGAYIAEAPIDTTGGDLAIITPSKKLKMYDNNSSTVLPILYTDGLSTVAGFGNCFNSPVSSNETVIFGRDNDLSGKLETSVCIGNSNFGSLTGPSSDNVVAGEYCCTSLLTGNSNIAAGYGALPLLANGSNNISIGSGSGPTLVTGDNNIYIGDQVGLSIESDTVRIGNTSTNRAVIKGVFNTVANYTAQLTSATSDGQIQSAGLYHMSDSGYCCITGSPLPSQNVGNTFLTAFGKHLLTLATSASANTLFGNNILSAATTGCNSNNVFGTNSLIGCQGGISNNTVYGSNCCIQNFASNLSNNVIIGNSSAQNVNGAVGNIVIGTSVGNNMTDNTNNILIGSQGVASEDNVVRVGTSGIHSSCFLQGITSSPLSNKKAVVTDSSTGQLGYEDLSHMAVGESYFENFAAPYGLPLIANTPTEVAFTQTLVSNMPMDFNVTTAGRLRWLNASTTMFHCAISMSALLLSGSNQDCAFYIAVNGVKVVGSEIRRRLQSTTVWEMVTFHKVVTLAQNQYLSIFANNLTGNNGISFGNINIVVMGTH